MAKLYRPHERHYRCGKLPDRHCHRAQNSQQQVYVRGAKYQLTARILFLDFRHIHALQWHGHEYAIQIVAKAAFRPQQHAIAIQPDRYR